MQPRVPRVPTRWSDAYRENVGCTIRVARRPSSLVAPPRVNKLSCPTVWPPQPASRPPAPAAARASHRQGARSSSAASDPPWSPGSSTPSNADVTPTRRCVDASAVRTPAGGGGLARGRGGAALDDGASGLSPEGVGCYKPSPLRDEPLGEAAPQGAEAATVTSQMPAATSAPPAPPVPTDATPAPPAADRERPSASRLRADREALPALDTPSFLVPTAAERASAAATAPSLLQLEQLDTLLHEQQQQLRARVEKLRREKARQHEEWRALLIGQQPPTPPAAPSPAATPHASTSTSSAAARYASPLASRSDDGGGLGLPLPACGDGDALETAWSAAQPRSTPPPSPPRAQAAGGAASFHSSLESLAEFEALLEEQHAQLVARGFLSS